MRLKLTIEPHAINTPSAERRSPARGFATPPSARVRFPHTSLPLSRFAPLLALHTFYENPMHEELVSMKDVDLYTVRR